MSEDVIQVEGVVVAVLPGTLFRVQLAGKQHELLCHISGKLRKNFIRLAIGDKVKIEVSPYDLHKGRIVYRMSNRVAYHAQHDTSAPGAGTTAPAAPRPPASSPQRRHSSGNNRGRR